MGQEPWREEQEAIAWKDGGILAVGSNASIREVARREGLPVTDADGRIIAPGFVDAHTHFLHIGVKRHRPDFGRCGSLQEALELLAAWLRDHPGSDPVIGERWDEAHWTTRVRPTRAELDRVTAAAAKAGHGPPDRQVVVRRVCGHVAVANSAALVPIRARWDDDRLVQPATGHLFEDASLYLNEVIGTSSAVLAAALEDATQECLRLGITTVGDYSQAPYRQALLAAARAGTLGIRVASSIYTQQLEAEVKAGFRTGRAAGAGAHRRFRDGGLKVFLDGSLGAHTAALREEYEDARAAKGQPAGLPGHAAHAGHTDHAKGQLNWTDREVERWFVSAHQAGIQVHAHAIGDAAVDQGLQGFANIATHAWNDNALRHRFEHYEIVHPEQMGRTAELGVVSSSQPNFVGTWSAKGGMYEERLGRRFGLNNRFQDMLQAGIRVAFGSDGMPPGPLKGIAAAVGHPVASQRMDARQAVWHYTWWAAWSLHWEDDVGSLEQGKRADMVVLQASKDGSGPWGLEGTYLDGQKVA